MNWTGCHRWGLLGKRNGYSNFTTKMFASWLVHNELINSFIPFFIDKLFLQFIPHCFAIKFTASTLRTKCGGQVIVCSFVKIMSITVAWCHDRPNMPRSTGNPLLFPSVSRARATKHRIRRFICSDQQIVLWMLSEVFYYVLMPKHMPWGLTNGAEVKLHILLSSARWAPVHSRLGYCPGSSTKAKGQGTQNVACTKADNYRLQGRFELFSAY